ncbi:Flagellar biosynthesis protein, FliO [Symmachiella dynata]|uniref:Flagellar biosynthesis protein, FliO n=1 Tax=Symmachiella dynata TaxID=2527995 RepID=A0A517ZGS7_9PLAN|nr:flagellar biosynthetic protein FliO [Symmachiella dynata]QDU41651.1 Flagellar biosynthesis protein, FliO [Symmachiella dynata]
MTRNLLFAFVGLCVWAGCALPAVCLAAPPKTASGNSNPPAVIGEAQKQGFQNPLDKKFPQASTAKKSSASSTETQRKKKGGSLVQSALGLAFVLCLILIVAAWAKRHLPQANSALPSEAVQILGQRAVGQRQMIQLIRCGSRILVLGATPNGLTTLSEITDPVEVDYLAGLCRQDHPHSVTSAFSRLFQNYRDMSDDSTPPANPMGALSSKLRRTDPATDVPQNPPHQSMTETSAETPERSLKERLGRLGPSGDSSRFSPPGAEGSYE